MASKQTQTIPIKIILTEAAYARLTAPLTDKSEFMTSEVLSNSASQLLEKYAGGGIMLDSVALEEIEKVTGKLIQSSREVVQFAEVAHNRDEGGFSLRVSVDPAMIEPMQTRATEMGYDSAEMLLNECVNQCLVNGWALNLIPMGGSLHFNEADWERVKKLVGKPNPLGSDLIERFKRRDKAE